MDRSRICRTCSWPCSYVSVYASAANESARNLQGSVPAPYNSTHRGRIRDISALFGQRYFIPGFESNRADQQHAAVSCTCTGSIRHWHRTCSRFYRLSFFFLVLLNLYQHEKLGELERVAVSLGADKNTIRFRVQLPILMKGLFPILILYIIFFMGAYDIPLLLGQSSPQMISVLILEKLQRFNLGDIPVAYSMAVLYALICIVTVSYLLLIYRKKEAV